jgi:hypothetical protein
LDGRHANNQQPHGNEHDEGTDDGPGQRANDEAANGANRRGDAARLASSNASGTCAAAKRSCQTSEIDCESTTAERPCGSRDGHGRVAARGQKRRDCSRVTRLSNKGMKQTSVERNGASQLNSSVRRTSRRATERTRPGRTAPATPAAWPMASLARPKRARTYPPPSAYRIACMSRVLPASLSSEAHARSREAWPTTAWPRRLALQRGDGLSPPRAPGLALVRLARVAHVGVARATALPSSAR